MGKQNGVLKFEEFKPRPFGVPLAFCTSVNILANVTTQQGNVECCTLLDGLKD